MTARNEVHARPSGGVRIPALHVDIAALHSMQGIEPRDDVSTPTYPFDSGVDETSDIDTVGSRKSLCLAISPRTARGYQRDKTFASKGSRFGPEKEMTPSQTRLELDIPDTFRMQGSKRPADPLQKNRKLVKLKHRERLGKSKSGLDLEALNSTHRSTSKNSPSVAGSDDQSISLQTKKKKNLQWMDFKSSLKSPNESDQPSALRRVDRSDDGFSTRNTVRQNSVIHPDDWTVIEKEIQRYATRGGSSEKALHSLMRTISMAHTFNRLDWRMLVKTLGHEGISNSDFFSIYSWSTRKKVSETHPLTAYVKENTDITSERRHEHLHIGNASAEDDSFKQKRRRSRQFVPGPQGSKYVRTPRGYTVKNEKSKTPGELAIAEARVRNSVSRHSTSDSRESFMNGRVNASRENVQLPDIHLPHIRSNTEHLFRRFVPGKTIRSTKESKDPGAIAFDSSLQVRNINPSSLNPLYSNGLVRASTGSSYGSGGSGDGSLPLLDHRTNLVGAETPFSLTRTLNASTFMPVPRPSDIHKGQLAAISYKNRLREGITPKPPPATPESYQVPMGTLDEVLNQYDSMVGMRPGSAARSRASSGSAGHRRGPYCDACMSEEDTSMTESSLSSVGSQGDSLHSAGDEQHRQL